ncbi:hypothetical protein AJ78_08137 [Emergomyces pasteurianus Ep9510]|uniref:CST complex subunit Ten1 n=1 Tax=Emergomyces pasteurianus Ep9510 TaxID=1447872 RepID=A0A1J9P4D7_9EURO|nr:hypothetical protein AJ78_08137 [Emergomyces pasteurianus Ep9510]
MELNKLKKPPIPSAISQGPADPPPATRVFLSEIPKLPPGSKIRFLGCVSSYNISIGSLILEHNYPITSQPIPSISVDVNLLLESLEATDLQVGSWLNVLGYIRERLQPETLSSAFNKLAHLSHRNLSSPSEVTRSTYVEAVMVFSADAIHLGEYERVLQDWVDADKRIKRPD